jgi:hypothetical protein
VKVTWDKIESVFEGQGATRNQQNTARAIYNHSSYQLFLLTEFGIITERTFTNADSQSLLAQATGSLKDLASLDSFDLVDFIAEHALTFQQAASITPAQMSLLPEELCAKVTRTLMGEEGSDRYDPIRYSLSAIVQTGFPYKRIKGQQHFERKNGDLTVTMSAPNDIGLPSGIYPRLAFVHICSEIVKTKSRHISLGPSLKKFVVDDMGRPWSTGKKGTANKWRESLCSLFATSFTISNKQQEIESGVDGLFLKNVSIVDEAKLWWDNTDDTLEGAEIVVSEPFAETLLHHATPLDIRALTQLAELRSPLAFDLYCWLTYRYWKMEQFQKPIVRIPWSSLYEQLGTSIGSLRQFRFEVKNALKEVKKAYPQANFNDSESSYLVLTTSQPHISARTVEATTRLLDKPHT